MTITLDGTLGVTFPAGGAGNPAGAVVGTTDTQTLTNKTLTAPTVTGTLAAAAGTFSSTLGVTGATVLTGTATLNSTLAVAGGSFDAITITGSSTNSKGMRFQNSAASSKNYNIGSSGGGPSAAGSFFIYDDTAGATRMVIDTSGNVGIGTTSPTQKLQVNGAIIIGNFGSNQYLYFDGSTNYVGRNSTSGDIHLAAAGGTNIVFTVAAAEKMRISTAGNVSIGTASANPIADRVNGLVISQTSFATFRNVSNMALGLSGTSGSHIQFYTDNGSTYVAAGAITSNGSATTYSSASDYRLKQKVTSLKNALEIVSKLKPCKFEYIEGNQYSEGFIAHELQSVIPHAVTGEKDGTREEEYEITPAVPATFDADGKETTPMAEAVKGIRTVPAYQGVDASFLVATLTAAIQELKAIIDTQAARITALETE